MAPSLEIVDELLLALRHALDGSLIFRTSASKMDERWLEGERMEADAMRVYIKYKMKELGKVIP